MSCRSWLDGDLAILVVFAADYDVTRLAWMLADLLGRLRSDRVMWLAAAPRRPGTNDRPRKHGRSWPCPTRPPSRTCRSSSA